MSGRQTRRRRPDHWSSVHEHAQTRAAERLEGPLDPAEDRFLTEHLAECQDCSAISEAYASQQREIRSLPWPEPPRDLWARTSVAIESEAIRNRGRRRQSGFRLSPALLGGLSGLLVVAVVVGASFLSRPGPGPTTADATTPPPPSLASATPVPVPTPVTVTARVGWVGRNADGSMTVSFGDVGKVCSAESKPDCAPISNKTEHRISVSIDPHAVVISPNEPQIVVVDEGTKTFGGAIYVVPVPTPEPTTPGSPSPSVEPSLPGSPDPTDRSSSPPASADVSSTPSGSAEPGGSGDPGGSPDPSASPAGGAIAIIDNVFVVGEAAGYSGSGTWFAFSARPADNTIGPDVYLWQQGDLLAHKVTNDGRSIFSTWIGDRLLGSRAVPDVDGLAFHAETFLFDPATGQEQILAGPGIWRPIVDPTGQFAIFWDGTLKLAPSGLDWQPDVGRLVVSGWNPQLIDAPAASPDPFASGSPTAGVTPTPSPSPSPTPSPTPTPTDRPSDDPSVSPNPSGSLVAGQPAVLAEGALTEWDAQWDATGERIALWLADPVDPTFGHLSLRLFDRLTGQMDPFGALLAETIALPGFWIDDRSLAWATPPGQDGAGSRVEVFAWSGSGSGQNQTEPESATEGQVIIRGG